jgi:hypothetical protein
MERAAKRALTCRSPDARAESVRPAFSGVGPAADTAIMRFDARRAFPEGPDAFIRPVAFFALIGVMVVFAEVSPPSVQLAVAGVGLFVFGSIALMVIAKRLLADTRISSAILRLLPLLWVWFPPVWTAFCTYRGTHSWAWAVVVFLIGFLLWDLIGYLAKRHLRKRDGLPPQRPLRRRKSRQPPVRNAS